jgi:hypothetical protein
MEAHSAISHFVDNFFIISFTTMNLFSIIIGVMIGLCTGAFERHHTWLGVVAYFIMVAFYYAIMGGAFGK